MNATNRYLNELKKKTGIESDYGLANALGVSRQRVSNYRQDLCSFDNDMALRVGEMLGVNPMLIIADVEAEKSKDEERRKTWENFSRRLRGIGAAIVLIVLGIPAVPQTAEAGSLYIMLRGRWRKQRGGTLALAV